MLDGRIITPAEMARARRQYRLAVIFLSIVALAALVIYVALVWGLFELHDEAQRVFFERGTEAQA